ncbi:MAG: Fe-S cluster assembly protein SufD [Alphaproteobacteria bacterium]
MSAEPTPHARPEAAHAATTLSLHRERFGELAAKLPGCNLPWLARLREESAEKLGTWGFPTTKDEAWHYTNLRSLAETALAPSLGSLGSVGALPPSPAGSARLVFVGGQYRADLSDHAKLPKGVVVAPLAEVTDGSPDLLEPHLGSGTVRDGLAALNAAFMSDGVVIRVPSGARLDAPVHVIVHGAAGRASHLRLLVVAEPASEVTLVEHYVTQAADPAWTNVVTQAAIGEGAVLRHVKIQDEAATAFHTARVEAMVGAGGAFESFVLAKGGRLARHEIDVSLEGEGARCALNGITLARARQHIDNTTVIDHRAPGCTSDELYRGVLDDEARAVFQGRIVVRPGAQKTDAHQLNENLLLSERAEIDTKPELEIHADDVKCGHGATAGALDEQALFYLQARGIGRSHATAMLIEAFVSDLLERVADDRVARLLHDAVAGWLPTARMTEVAA